MSHFESTFKGHELLYLLEPVVSDAFIHNLVRMQSSWVKFVMEEHDWPSMEEFLSGSFAYDNAIPSPKFWHNITKEYSEENELLAFSELTLI